MDSDSGASLVFEGRPLTVRLARLHDMQTIAWPMNVKPSLRPNVLLQPSVISSMLPKTVRDGAFHDFLVVAALCTFIPSPPFCARCILETLGLTAAHSCCPARARG